MHIKTARFELEYHRGHSLYIAVELRRGRWETLRDWTGSGLSSTSWTPTKEIVTLVEEVA